MLLSIISFRAVLPLRKLARFLISMTSNANSSSKCIQSASDSANYTLPPNGAFLSQLATLQKVQPPSALSTDGAQPFDSAIYPTAVV